MPVARVSFVSCSVQACHCMTSLQRAGLQAAPSMNRLCYTSGCTEVGEAQHCCMSSCNQTISSVCFGPAHRCTSMQGACNAVVTLACKAKSPGSLHEAGVLPPNTYRLPLYPRLPAIQLSLLKSCHKLQGSRSANDAQEIFMTVTPNAAVSTARICKGVSRIDSQQLEALYLVLTGSFGELGSWVHLLRPAQGPACSNRDSSGY
mgnify:FL=1